MDVRQLVRDSRAMCGHRLEGVEIRTELPDEPVYVQGDPVDLTQVVVNLLVNAALATESLPERWIRLLVEPEHGFVRIDVQDSGTTPAPDVRRAMFTRGFTTRADAGGSGLGLDICARVVEAHGGAISLDETAEHTTFQVLLPGAGAGARAALA